MSKTSTIVRMRRNGGLVRVKPDGTEEALETPSLAPRSAAEIEAAAPSRWPAWRTLPRYLSLLALYGIGEQGRSEPDQPAKAYLTVIARDPEGVERALHPVSS